MKSSVNVSKIISVLLLVGCGCVRLAGLQASCLSIPPAAAAIIKNIEGKMSRVHHALSCCRFPPASNFLREVWEVHFLLLLVFRF